MTARPHRRWRSSLVGAVFLVALWGLLLWARARAPLALSIDQLVPRHTYSTVRIAGVLASDARRMSDGRILLVVNDGTGTLPVFISDLDASLPHCGRRVIVTGRVCAEINKVPYLQVFRSEAFELLPIARPGVEWNCLPLKHVGRRIGRRATVRGYVVALHPASAGSAAPNKIVLEDPGGRLEVVYWFNLKTPVALGDALEVRGRVERYRNALQFKLFEAADVCVLH